MAGEDIDMSVSIKMEYDDEEDPVGWALEESIFDDPLLTLKPVVYTTKLDEMNTVKQDLRGLNAEEITKKLQSENKPILTFKNMHLPSYSKNEESFRKLCSVINHINFKARLQKHNIRVRNMKLVRQCKPLRIILKDIKKTIQSVAALNNVFQCESAIIVSPTEIGTIHVKVEAIESHGDKIIKPQNKSGVIISSDNRIKEVEMKNIKTEPCEPESNEAIPVTEDNVSASNLSNTVATQEKNAEIVSFASGSKNNKSQHNSTESTSTSMNNQIRKPKRVVDPESSDDETALINLKRKPIISLAVIQGSFEKFALIVLLHQKEEAFVYRVNPTKLITDYFIMKQYDDYKLAAMYPKEDKIIELFCCWFKREEAITKICTRKNYPFSIQKFMRLPHDCHSGDCRCCCRTNRAADQSKQTQTRKRGVVNKSIAIADSWIRGLLDRNNPVAVGLVSKALSYIPNRKINEQPVSKEPEKYLEFILLCMKYSRNDEKNFKNVAELYEIGKNGYIVRSFLLESCEEEQYIRRIYHFMGIKSMEVEFCCWYKREKIMRDLRIVKMSPAALKLIQMSHSCERNNCRCCCKPYSVSLEAFQALPTTLKHTTSYEKNERSLTIRFNLKSKTPIKVNESRHESNKAQYTTDASAAAIVLSNCAFKENKKDLSITILDKFKNLKLGVTADGKLETILDVPARNLSIAELKVLSDILALSTKQIAELGLSPEEFCNRIIINLKSGQPKCDEVVPPENLLISAPETETTSPPKQNDSTNQQIKSIGTTISPPSQNKHSKEQQKRNTLLNDNINNSVKKITAAPPKKTIVEAMRKTTTTSTKKVSSGNSLATNTYSSISNLMETKNKNYVDSFKSFFKNVVPCSVAIPEMSKLSDVPRIATTAASEQFSSLGLPKIAETFSLAPLLKSSTKTTDLEIAGPSGISRQPQVASSGTVGASTSPSTIVNSSKTVNPKSSGPSGTNSTPTLRMIPITTYSNKNVKRKALNPDLIQAEDKRIRVKSPNELMATKTQGPVIILNNNLQTQPIPIRPAPIIVKKGLYANISSVVNPSNSAAQILNSTLQSQGYLVQNNKEVPSPNTVIGIVNTTSPVNNVYQINGNAMTGVYAGPSQTANNAGLRYLTLTPIKTAKSNSVDKSMLARILQTPQVQPTANGLPPLIPFNTAPTTIQNVISNQGDVENSISYNVIIDNNTAK